MSRNELLVFAEKYLKYWFLFGIIIFRFNLVFKNNR